MLENLLKPLMRRLGTAIAAAAMTLGATSDDAHLIASGVIALLGLVFDLSLSFFNRRN